MQAQKMSVKCTTFCCKLFFLYGSCQRGFTFISTHLSFCPTGNKLKRQNRRTNLSSQFGFINATTKLGLLEPSNTLMITKLTIL